jgi:hypothetical protein
VLTPDKRYQLDCRLCFLNRLSSRGLKDLSFKRIVNDVEIHGHVSYRGGLLSLVRGEA